MENLVGAVASAVSFVLWWPQARKTFLLRKDPEALAGLSRGTFFLLLVNAVAWAVYGAMTGAFWVAAPGLVNGPLALWVLVLTSAREVREAAKEKLTE